MPVCFIKWQSKVICYLIIKFNNKPTKLLLLIIHFNKRNVWIYPILVPYTGLKFAHPPPRKRSYHGRLPHTRFLFPQQMVNSAPTKLQLSGYSPIKTSFLVAVITIFVLYHFYYSFIFFIHRDHANFDFSRCSIFRGCCFQFKITPP